MNKLTAATNITWLLIGLLLSGSLVNCLPVLKDSVVFSEERVLETDDDRSDAKDIDFAICVEFSEFSTSQTWSELQVFCFKQFSSQEFSSNSERGPPAC
jgi:hypothetical protein